MEGESNYFALSAAVEEGTQLGFCRGSHNKSEDCTEVKDSPVHFDWFTVALDATKEEVATD